MTLCPRVSFPWTSEGFGFFYRVHSLQLTEVLSDLSGKQLPIPPRSPSTDSCALVQLLA